MRGCAVKLAVELSTNMTSEQWQRVKELFEAALEHGQHDRSDFLNTACPEDHEVRTEVESLLDAHERDSGFMNEPVGSLLPEDSSILPNGTRLGNYEITFPLGKGGMGQVYLAQDIRLGRKVALKLLPTSDAPDADHVRRLEQEARAASALNHPNIVTIHEIGEADSIHFMATEFVDGETLRQRMVASDLSVRDILDISVQIASALRAAHDAGIVHRDIKPENIMLRRDGVVKVLDFGLAKLFTERWGEADTGRTGDETKTLIAGSPLPPVTSSPVTNAGVIMGTTAYMSPEQARGERVDARTDVWSLGVVLYEMLSGSSPFVGETHREVIRSIIETDPAPLNGEIDVPGELQRIVAKALAKDVNDRYETAGGMARDLKSLQEELEVLARLQREDPDENQKEAVARRIGFDTARHSPTNTVGLDRVKGNVRDYIRVIQRHKVFAGVALILFAGALAWAYFASDRNKVNSASVRRRSIAVLPLKPINSATSDDVYQVGIADAVIRRLSAMNGVVVRQLSATRQYTNPAQDPIAAGKEQQVDYVLASEYQFVDQKIRVNAQLFNVATEQAEKTYQIEKDASDIFTVQDAIAQEIGNDLSAQFASTSDLQTVKRGTINEEAYRLYLQGMYLANKRNGPDSLKAIATLEQAVSLDPNYARAWAGLGYAHRTVSLYQRTVSTRETYEKSMVAINKALTLDPNLSEAHSALCENKYLFDWKFPEAELECKLAIELDPNSSLAHEIYSRYLMGRGRHDEAIGEIKTAIDLDPSSRFNQRNYGRALFYARRYAEASDQLKRVAAMDENYLQNYSWLSAALSLQGKESEAYEWFRKYLSLVKAKPETVQVFEKAFRSSGWRGVLREWSKILDEGGLEEGVRHNFSAVLFRAQLGEKDKAFEHLERLYQEREVWMTYLRVEPRLDPLRDDPRFQDLLRRVESN